MLSVVKLSFEFNIYKPIMLLIFESFVILFSCALSISDESYFYSLDIFVAWPIKVNLITTSKLVFSLNNSS